MRPRKTQKNHLYRGEIALVIIAIEQLIGKKPAEDQTTWLNYFVNHGLTHRRNWPSDTHKPRIRPNPTDPMFSIAPSISPVRTSDLKAYALQRLRQTAETTIQTVDSHAPIQIDGLDGFESIATGRDKSSSVPLTLYQVILFQKEEGIRGHSN